MKTVSEGFKTEAKSYARNELVKFIEKGTNNVIDGEYIVDGFLQEISYADDTLVGNTPAKNLEVNILNPNSVEYMGKEIEVYTGLTVNGQQEFVKHGTFIIDSSEEDVAKGTVKVTALDYMIKFNKTFVDELDWSVTRTLREFAEYVCEKCNMTLSSKAFPNDSYVLTEQPAFEGYSCRYVLGKIAEIAGSIAIINENDEAEIKPLTISNEYEDILVDSIMAMEVSETAYLPYNAVMISLAEGVEGENVTQRDEVSIEAYGERCLKIANNEFAINETVRQNLIKAIFSSINGFFYIPMSITYNSYDWLARLDKIHVYYDDEHYYETYLLNHTIEFPSSISSTIACESKSTTNTSFEYVPVAEQKQAHTEIVVDKLNKKITSTVEEVNSQSEKITQVTQNLESVNLSISNVEKGVADLETDLATTNKNLASTNQTVTDLEGDVDALSADLNGVSQDFADFKDNEYVQSIENLQNQIDGAIQFWNGADKPTLSNYPTNEWTTEADKNNHRADIYTVIQDVDGVMKQGKSYRFDKVDGVWQWIELTDNELSAVQEIAQNALKQANTNATDITTLKQTDTEIKANIEGIQLNYNTLNNQFDSTVITSKTVEGNPTHITDAGDYDLDRLYLEGNNYQEITQQGRNILDLTKVELVQTSNITAGEVEITDISANSFTYRNLKTIGSWTNFRFLLNDILEDGKLYTFTVNVSEDSEQNSAGAYGTVGFNRMLKGSTSVDSSKSEISITDKTGRIVTAPQLVDKQTYDYYLMFFPTQTVSQVESCTIKYTRLGIYEEETINNVSMELGNLNIDTGLNENSDTRIRCKDYIDIKDCKYVVVVANPLLTSATTIGVRFYDKDYKYLASNSLSLANKAQFTRPTEARYFKFIITNTNLSQKYAVCLKNTVGYEEFVPNSPSPDYPQEIEVIEGSVDVEVSGDNLIDWSKSTNNIGTFENDTITITTTGAWKSKQYVFTEFIKNNAGKRLCFSCESYSFPESVNANVQINWTQNGTTKYNSLFNKNGTRNSFLIPEDTSDITWAVLAVYSNNSTDTTTECTTIITKPILYFGELNNPPAYEPYKSTTASLDLQDNFIAKIGDVADELDVVTGKLNKNVGRVQLNGLESLAIEVNSDVPYTRFSTTILNARGTGVQNRYPIKSTHFKNIASGGHDVGGAFIYQSKLFIYLPLDITSVEQAKAWLAVNKPIFYYDLAEPYEVQLDSTSIELNEGVNNIYVKTNIGPSFISLTYLTDSILNSQYATKTQLQLTKDSITSVVKDTTTLNANLTDLQALVNEETTDLKNALGDLTNDLEENYATNDSVLTVSNSVTNIQTSLNQQIEITKDIQVNGVSKVKTTTGFTFDEDGLTVTKTNADTKTTIDEDGMTVYSTTGSENTEMLIVDSRGVEAENVTVRTFLIVGSNSRFQDYETGTGCFYVGE